MTDKKENQPLSIYSSSDLPAELSEDQELKALLQRVSAPHAPASLDARIVAAYRRQIRSLPSASQEIKMKQCSTCQDEFADRFSFCPVDGTPLTELSAAAAEASPVSDGVTPHLASAATVASAPTMALVPAGEYHLTFVDDTGLTRRLMEEIRGVAHNSQLTWPEFKRDPFGYMGRMISGYGTLLWRFFSSRNVAIATSTALMVVLSLVILVIVIGKYQKKEVAYNQEDLIVQQWLPTDDIPAEEEKSEPDKGVGTGEGGRVGFNKGKGEGSLPQPKKAGGGGGGGQQEALPVQQGKIPPPSEIPGKLPTLPPLRQPPLPVAGINIDRALWKDLPYDRYGDPRSNSTATSAGTGTGNGMGNGTGAGIGEGQGEGFGKGRGRNMGGGDPADGGGGSGGGTGRDGSLVDYNRVFNPKEVNQKARILSRPEPQYTEDARKNQVSGTVVLRAVFSSGGQVTNIRTVSGLPYGLTERAIAAARQIRFTPAMKDGRAVSQYIQIEYNFNLY
jgi:TonB family protein